MDTPENPAGLTEGGGVGTVGFTDDGRGPTGPHAADDRPPPARRPVRRLPLWITVILWVVVAALAVVAAMRIVAWDSYDLFAILNSVTAFLYLPAWIVAVVAVVGRRYVLAAAALVVVVAQIVFMLPELTAAEPVPGWAAHRPQDQAVRRQRLRLQPVHGRVRRGDQGLPAPAPDHGGGHPLRRDPAAGQDGALADLPYTVQIKRYDPHAFFVASKYPLTDVHVDYLFGQPLIVKSTVQLPSGPQALWVVHTIGPVPRSRSTRGGARWPRSTAGAPPRPGAACCWSGTSTAPGTTRGSGRSWPPA